MAIKILLDFLTDLWYGIVLGKDGEKMTTLENLYYGNIAPHEYEVVRGSEYDITAKLVIRHEQELSSTLTEQQNAILQKIKDNHTELMNLGERDAFCRGFSLAVRLIVLSVNCSKESSPTEKNCQQGGKLRVNFTSSICENALFPKPKCKEPLIAILILVTDSAV